LSIIAQHTLGIFGPQLFVSDYTPLTDINHRAFIPFSLRAILKIKIGNSQTQEKMYSPFRNYFVIIIKCAAESLTILVKSVSEQKLFSGNFGFHLGWESVT